ncbi:hypothetical protein HNY73_004580 [Argiope bruennichi]|uniref:Uncharacterized protein n=1 Tax=Argiope bruennichi TaxID=94029 RepID=A0A8T0FPN2_ARGBR|nr:hypothetical protein HNY73_004580 [Argiope bruennichi]
MCLFGGVGNEARTVESCRCLVAVGHECEDWGNRVFVWWVGMSARTVECCVFVVAWKVSVESCELIVRCISTNNRNNDTSLKPRLWNDCRFSLSQILSTSNLDDYETLSECYRR